MWGLNQYKQAFIAVGLIGVIICYLPAAAMLVSPSEPFSEMYVLGPGHLTEGYPFNVSSGENYSVYLDVENHLNKAAYYEVYVKLRNSTEPLPNATSGAPSPLPVLYTYEVFLANNQTWENPLNFSFADVTFGENVSYISRMRVNDAWVNVNKTAAWDSVNSSYFYELFIELWLFNPTISSFAFHNRYVALILNMTMAA